MEQNIFLLQDVLEEYQVCYLRRQARRMDLKYLNHIITNDHFEGNLRDKYVPFSIDITPGILTKKLLRGHPMDIFVVGLSSKAYGSVSMKYITVSDIKGKFFYDQIVKEVSLNHLDSSVIFEFAAELVKRNILKDEDIRHIDNLRKWEAMYRLYMNDICQRRYIEIVSSKKLITNINIKNSFII